MVNFLTYKLYMGRTISTDEMQGQVNDTALSSWLKREVTPRYDGFTLFTAMGSWKGEHEKTAVLEIQVPMDDVCHLDPKSELPEPINCIAESYKSTFWQESVMVTVSPAIVEFV